MVDAIVHELRLRADYLEQEKIQTVYFGGGTPSLLNDTHFKKIFNRINEIYSVEEKAEITLEANPDDLSKEKLAILKENGINRLSIGVQSFFDSDLEWMNRSHNSLEAHQVIENTYKAGFNNLSVDLIFGGLHANVDNWQTNLDIVVDYKIPHISCYGLTVEERTALAHQLKTGKTSIASEDQQSTFYQMADKVLTEAGHMHYEISNYAFPGMLAKHNTSYWQQKPYIGIGPSAHSFNGHSRQWNVANNPKYLKALSDYTIPFEIEELSSTDVFNEYLLTGLRTIWGCEWNRMNELDEKATSKLRSELEAFVKDGQIEVDEDKIKLTTKGQLIADNIIASLFI